MLIFLGLNAQKTGETERQSSRSPPEEFENILSSANGASLFALRDRPRRSRKPEVRKADEAWRAFSLVSLNSDHERPENSVLDTIFFASCSDGRAAYATP